VSERQIPGDRACSQSWRLTGLLWPVRANWVGFGVGGYALFGGLALAQAIAFAQFISRMFTWGQAIQKRAGSGVLVQRFLSIRSKGRFGGDQCCGRVHSVAQISRTRVQAPV